MKSQNRLRKILTVCFLAALSSLLSNNLSAASSVSISVGTGYYDGSPYGPYYGRPYTPYASNVVYVPGHWYHGYWIPGQYIEYAGPAPGSGYVWYQGSFRNGHWHRGHWKHSSHHH